MDSSTKKDLTVAPKAVDVHDTTTPMGQMSEKGLFGEEAKTVAVGKGKVKMVDKGFQFPDLEVTHVDKVTPDLKVKPWPSAVFVDRSWVLPDSIDPDESSSSTESEELAYDPADHWTTKFRDDFDKIIMMFLPSWNPSMTRKRRRSEK